MTRPSPPFLVVLTLVAAAAIVTLTLPSVSAQSGPSQAGFLSIDCGATTAYTDTVSGINWVPDGNYTSVGTNVGPLPGSITTDNNAEARTLRYFKDSRKKFCYELPVQSNQTYLIIATFWYGNYDALSKPPVFKMAIDATEMLGIDLTGSLWASSIMRREYVRRVGLVQTTMSVCFYQDPTSLTTPFVSSIELRLLDPRAYNQPWIDDGNFLLSSFRQDFGGATLLRYPDDAYDRVWEPASIKGTTILSTTANISNRNLGIQPPQAVLRTAITPSNLSSLVLPYPYGSASIHIPCVYYLYFAEISDIATATSRAFSVSIPNDSPLPDTPVNIYNLSGGINQALVFYWTNMSLTDTSVVTLNNTVPPTVDGPLVAGAELLAKFPSLVPPTNVNDVTALADIKVTLSLTGWSGDPCLPVPYDWITCSGTTPPRVLTVNLNGYNLTGQIPAAFAQLASLTSLTLSNNNFTGEVPTALVRPGLALE